MNRRRALLERLAFSPESSDAVRLRALELIDRLDERERPVPEPPQFEYDDDHFAKIIDLGFETGIFQAHPAFRAVVEARVAGELRARFEAVGASGSGAGGDAATEPSEPPQAASEREGAREVHPHDDASFRLIARDDEPRPSRLSRR